jgi:GT2 family glycosyltransferase
MEVSNDLTPSKYVPGRVSIIIVSYNSQEHIDACLSTVLGQTYPDYEVILSDNDSTDNSMEYVRTRYPRVKIIENNANLGYANGINAALPHATGTLIAPLNIDTEVVPDWLAVMVRFLLVHPEVGAVTPKILLFDDRKRINTMGHHNHISGLTFCRRLNQLDDSSTVPEKVSGLSGCSYLIRRETLDRMGGEPADSFMSNDDVIVSWLIHLMGYEIYCLPEAVVYHKYRLKMNPDKLYRLEKDRQKLVLSIFNLFTIVLLSPVLLAVEIMIFVYCVLKGRTYFRAKCASLASFFREKPLVNERRLKYRSLRQVSDWSLVRKLKWGLAWRQLFSISNR